MAWNGFQITPPVTIAEVQSAIGSNYNSLGDLIYWGADGGDINMYAKYKPVIYDRAVSGMIAALTDAERAHTYTRTNGSLPCTVHHGIMVPDGSDYNTMVENATTNPGVIKHAIWEYDFPTGGSYQPYRLTDFSGYSPQAVCPVAFYCNAKGELPIPVSGNGTIITFILRANQAANRGNNRIWRLDTCLSWADLVGSYPNYYFTVHMICKVNGRTFRYTKSGGTVYSMFQNNPVNILNIDTSVIKSIFSGEPCINAGAVWNAVMMLTANYYAGDQYNHEMMTGRVMRLEYEQDADRRSLTVVQTSWTDNVVYLKFKAYVKKNTAYSNRYYIEKIVVEYEVSIATNCAVEIEYMCPSGYLSGVTTETLLITDSINMVGESDKTYQNTQIQTDFVCTQSFPDGAQIGVVSMRFTKDGATVSKDITMRLDTISTSMIFEGTVIDNS